MGPRQKELKQAVAALGWQFHLRDLFALMTAVAVAAALAASLGPGTLVGSAGFLVAWLNWRGACQVLQAGRAQVAVLGLAWLLFVVSMFLPSIRIFGPVQGYAAAWIALTGPLYALGRGEGLQSPLLVLGLIDLANILMSLLPIISWRLARGSGKALAATLCSSMIAIWLVAWNTPMLVGYYVWSASFMLALAALPLQSRTIVGMSAAAMTCLVILSVNAP